MIVAPNFDFCPEFRFFEQNFHFLLKFWFLPKLIFDQNFDFWPKFIFFYKSCEIWPKFGFSTKFPLLLLKFWFLTRKFVTKIMTTEKALCDSSPRLVVIFLPLWIHLIITCIVLSTRQYQFIKTGKKELEKSMDQRKWISSTKSGNFSKKNNLTNFLYKIWPPKWFFWMARFIPF